MVVITTFNEEMYHATGKGMLESVSQMLPTAKQIVYDELKTIKLDAQTVKVCELDTFKQVFKENKDVITEQFGGYADKTVGNNATNRSWNIRWFGWFRKVVMNHHAICETGYDDYVIFADSDIRFIKPFDESFLKEVTQGKAVSYFKGSRPAIDSGFVVVNGKDPNSKLFYEKFMNMFLTKEYKKLQRWDDGYVMTKIVKKTPDEWTHDFAKGKQQLIYKNTTGYITGGQVIPTTVWKDYIEHDKGIHWKQDIVPHAGMYDPGNNKPKKK